jgi:putative endonuclease
MVYTADLKSLPAAGRRYLKGFVGSNLASNSTVIVYALRSLSDGGLYIGITKDLARRLHQHNSGYQRSTRSRRPFQLLYSEEVSDLPSARSREKYLKSGVGREFLRSLTTPAEESL